MQKNPYINSNLLNWDKCTCIVHARTVFVLRRTTKKHKNSNEIMVLQSGVMTVH